MDLKWSKMPSKVNFGHPNMADRSEMARNAIESDFRTSKMVDLKWPELLSKVNFRHPKWPNDLQWLEMQSKVIFEHSKCPPAAIL